MWHRFPQPFRQLVLAALQEAARHNRDAATPKDFVAAIAHVPACAAAQLFPLLGSQLAKRDTSDVDPVNAISPEAMKLFERAYEEAASLGDRIVGSDHFLMAVAEAGVLKDMKCGAYHQLCEQVKHLRRIGVGPDSPRRHDISMARFVRPMKKAFQAVTNLYKLHRGLSALHPKLVGDPHDLYDRIRDIAPVRRDPLLPAWVVTGYPEAVSVLRDPRFSSEPRSNRTKSGTMEVEMLPDGPVRRDLCVIANVLTKMMVFSDAPVHSRMRNQLGQMFSPRNVAGLRDRIQQIADELIDAVSARRKMDFVQDFANPLPLLVVADIMGFRREDKVDLKRWSDVFGVMLSFSTTIRQDLEGRAAMLEMRQYFDRIVDDLRREPNDSMLSQLITPRDGTAPIDFDELFANCVFLLAAGHETTASTMSSGIRLLLTKHPGELQRLIDDPSLIPNAAEELLRMESPVQWTSRRAKEDLELGGQKIAKNSMVMISMGAANRDPRQFPDPHRLDITRKDANRHLAFSGGNHFCLGAGLARIELQVGLSTLLRRLKNLCIEDGFEVEWRKGHTLHAFDHLPMTFDMFTKSGTGASPVQT